jgi:hypothetical protein
MLGNASKADVAVPCLACNYPVWMHVAPDLVWAELRLCGDLHFPKIWFETSDFSRKRSHCAPQAL